MTGMTRDGTFLIENGKVAGRPRNFRFNQSLIELLNNVRSAVAFGARFRRRDVRHGGAGDESARLPFHRSHAILMRAPRTER